MLALAPSKQTVIHPQVAKPPIIPYRPHAPPSGQHQESGPPWLPNWTSSHPPPLDSMPPYDASTGQPQKQIGSTLWACRQPENFLSLSRFLTHSHKTCATCETIDHYLLFMTSSRKAAFTSGRKTTHPHIHTHSLERDIQGLDFLCGRHAAYTSLFDLFDFVTKICCTTVRPSVRPTSKV